MGHLKTSSLEWLAMVATGLAISITLTTAYAGIFYWY